jgi:hypothetical protein
MKHVFLFLNKKKRITQILSLNDFGMRGVEMISKRIENIL